MSLQDAVIAMLIQCFLGSPTVSSAKHPHTIASPPSCFMGGTTHVETFTHLFCVSHKHCSWNQKSKKLDLSDQSSDSTSLMSILCVFWPKPVSSSCSSSSELASLWQFVHKSLIHTVSSEQLMLCYLNSNCYMKHLCGH